MKSGSTQDAFNICIMKASLEAVVVGLKLPKDAKLCVSTLAMEIILWLFRSILGLKNAFDLAKKCENLEDVLLYKTKLHRNETHFEGQL